MEISIDSRIIDTRKELTKDHEQKYVGWLHGGGPGTTLQSTVRQPSHMNLERFAFSPSCKDLLHVCTPYIKGP